MLNKLEWKAASEKKDYYKLEKGSTSSCGLPSPADMISGTELHIKDRERDRGKMVATFRYPTPRYAVRQWENGYIYRDAAQVFLSLSPPPDRLSWPSTASDFRSFALANPHKAPIILSSVVSSSIDLLRHNFPP